MRLWVLACRLFGHPWDYQRDLCVRCWRTGASLHYERDAT